MRHLAILVSFALSATFAGAQVGTIDTVAGGGPDNLPATEANLDNPNGVAVDVNGNVYVADSTQNRVFKVDRSGLLTVVAGSGSMGFGGDGGAAAAASLQGPRAVALAPAGHLFIADTGNSRIRRVDAFSGVITTVAGNGVVGFSGDGGPATSASLAFPMGLAVDKDGNLFFADLGNHRVRRVELATGVITTVAGGGTPSLRGGDGGLATFAGLASPTGLAVDAVGNLFITCEVQGAAALRFVEGYSGLITSVPGLTNRMHGLAVDAANHVFVAEPSTERIRRVDMVTGAVITVAGGGTGGDGVGATDARLRGAGWVAVDPGGSLYIAESVNRRIRRVDAATGLIGTVAGTGAVGFSGDGAPATSASLRSPNAIAVDVNGNLFVADTVNRRVRRVNAATSVITTVAGNGTDAFSGDGGPATSASLRFPTGLAVDSAGNVFISDSFSQRVRRVDAATGVISTVAGGGPFGRIGDGGPATGADLRPCDVAVDAGGHLLIGEAARGRVRRVDAVTGIITTVAGGTFAGSAGDGGPATSAALASPCALALDGQGNLFIAELTRIRRVDAATGLISTVAGGGAPGVIGDGGPATSAFLQPTGVAADAAGNVLIAERNTNRVRRVDADTRIITTVAGTGIFGFDGDGGPATGARLAFPVRVAVGDGILIADMANNRIRRVVLNHAPAADAGPDQTLILGEAGTFDGGGSHDADGTIESYSWTFGDGSSATGSLAEHAYAAGGTYTVTLTVTDDQGATGSDTALVTVVAPSQAIDLLGDVIESYNLQQGISNSLDKKLELARAALAAVNAGERADAANRLQSFMNEVEAQRDNALASAQADDLIGWATRIIGVL